MYNHYYLFVIISGIILLIAMLGSITLVLQENDSIINQNIAYLNTKIKCIIKNYSIKN